MAIYTSTGSPFTSTTLTPVPVYTPPPAYDYARAQFIRDFVQSKFDTDLMSEAEVEFLLTQAARIYDFSTEPKVK